MEWKLAAILKEKINQSGLVDYLIKSGWSDYTASALLVKLQYTKSPKKFFAMKDSLKWYRMFRTHLDTTPMELIGVKTDEDAIAQIILAKLGNPDFIESIEVKLKEDAFKPVEPEVLAEYIGVARRP
jgi:hypothetical protein